MKHYLLLILSIFLSSISIMAQNNLIRNPGFEDGSPDPDKLGFSFKDLDIWENSFWDSPVNNAPNWHSTDWYKVGSFSWGTPANSGLGYIGMIDHELAQQKLENNNQLEEDKWYEAKMFIYLSGYGPGNFSTVFDESELKIYLAKHKIKYNQEDDKIPYIEFCKSDYKTLKTGGNQDIKKYVVVSDLTVFPIDDGWHEVSTFIKAPSPNYNWFGIEVVAKSGCQNAYVLIDDVSLEKVCVEDCVNGCSPTDGQMAPQDNGQLSYTMPFSIWDLDNVISAKLTISTILTQYLIFQKGYYCADGIKRIEWDGFVNPGYAANAPYLWELEVTNDCGSCSFNGIVVKYDDYLPGATISDCNPLLAPEPCCEYDIYIDDVTLSGTYEFVAVHNIYIATNGTVTVSDNANVLFQAGNEIIVGTYDYNEELGSAVDKLIIPCPNGKKGNDDNNNNDITETINEEEQEDELQPNDINETSGISIHPNPATTTFTIQGSFALPAALELYDLTGRQVYRQPVTGNKQQVNVGSLAAGLYVYRLVSGGKVARGKIILE